MVGAALLSLALCGTVELFRQQGTFAAPDTAGLVGRAADMPSILLGTGLAGLFAVSYATYGVYGYVGPAPAFLAMAAAALGGIAASFAYGPALGILGYLAAESVPFLVAGSNDVAGAAYVALVGAAGYAPLSAPSDLGLECALALSAAVAASHLRRATGLRALGQASRVLAVAAAPFLALAVLLNPFVTGTHLGAWRFLNLLVLAYALPGVLAGRSSMKERISPPPRR